MERNNSSNDKEISFSDLMRENVVRIPPIQREYAQGRADALAIRHGFVEALLRCDKAPVSLDFVYGVFDKEEEDNIFVPLDGQQRLTTLFLLYWYFGAIGEKWKEFEYSSRRMAMCFLKFLREVHTKYLNKKGYVERKAPSQWLKSCAEFVPAWECDSTIAGMLVVLDEIHSQTSRIRSVVPASSLDRITFFIQKCDNSISADETYLKINARGEALTEWENIKAILDSRAKEIVNANLNLSYNVNPIVDAAREWREKINGEWIACLENLLPEKREGILYPPYIAVSIAMLNAAFRNIIDLAAASLTATSVGKIVEAVKNDLGEAQIKEVGFAAAVLGERTGSASVNSEEELAEFYTKAFLDHTAIYSDYRDSRVWADEAFVIVARIFKVIADGTAVGFWPFNRAENKFWGGSGDLKSFKNEMLFTNVKPTDASLDDNDKKGFSEILEKLRDGNYSGRNFTYLNALRMLSISRCDGSPYGSFALSRCLNLLDAECFTASPNNFCKLNDMISEFQYALTTGDQAKAFSKGQLAIQSQQSSRLIPPRLAEIMQSEQIKFKLFSERGLSADVTQLSFWKIEKQLPLMSGVVHFTFDAEIGDFDESRASFFLDNLMCSDNVAKDVGFLALMEFMPELPDFMILPTSSKKDEEGYCQWRDFLLQQQVADAFNDLFKSQDMANERCPLWVHCYKDLVTASGWAYRMIGMHEYKGGNRVFAYTGVSKMTKDSKCLSYLHDEKIMFKLVRNGKIDKFISWDREQRIPFADNEHFMISVDSIMGENNCKVEIWCCDNEGNKNESPCFSKKFASVDEKRSVLRQIIDDIKSPQKGVAINFLLEFCRKYCPQKAPEGISK